MFKKEIFKISDVDISCRRYERNLLVIFQCHWELVKIPHTKVATLPGHFIEIPKQTTEN